MKDANLKVTTIILAAGKGTRMNAQKNKVFLKLKKPILAHTIEAFEKNEQITEIIVVSNEDETEQVMQVIDEHHFHKVSKIISGGETRQESCYNGVVSCDNSDIILIHDGARPFVRQETISQSIFDAQINGISVVGVPVKDTIKVESGGFVETTLDRTKLWAVQTPQAFQAEIIKKSHEKALIDDFIGTDDTSLAERLGYKVKLTLGHYDNIKITTPDDLFMAEKILKENGDEFN
jgi:2-C-methyl-D-erythritol 4-phosphate cytidylyltransferase